MQASCAVKRHDGWYPAQICKKMAQPDYQMARELELNGRRYWIISDPYGEGWKAKVVELHAGGEADEIGIEASDQTRTAADNSAERKLRRLLQLPHRP